MFNVPTNITRLSLVSSIVYSHGMFDLHTSYNLDLAFNSLSYDIIGDVIVVKNFLKFYYSMKCIAECQINFSQV